MRIFVVPSFESAGKSRVLENYRHSNAVILIGFGEGADTIAKHYYDFFAVQPPLGVVLIGPHVGAFYLNSITCPYFVIHGERDPDLSAIPYREVEAAIYHHQMRYGDITSAYLFPDFGAELGLGSRLPAPVWDEIKQWLDHLARVGQPKQEREPTMGAIPRDHVSKFKKRVA